MPYEFKKKTKKYAQLAQYRLVLIDLSGKLSGKKYLVNNNSK